LAKADIHGQAVTSGSLLERESSLGVILMLPGALASAIMMPIIGKLTSKYSPRVLTAIGVIGVSVATLMLHILTMNTGPDQLFWPLILRGASMGFLWVPLSLATLVLRPQPTGLIWGYLFYRTRSIWPGVLWHTSFTTLGVLFF
jgi:membrane protease YdiL (CAAX protease family)